MKKTSRKTERSESVSIRVTPEELEFFEAAARADQRTVSEMIRVAAIVWIRQIKSRP